MTTSQLVGSYFATNLLKDLALNGIQLSMLSHVMTALENLVENKKDRAVGHMFGKKYFLQVGIDQILTAADEAEEMEKAAEEVKTT